MKPTITMQYTMALKVFSCLLILIGVISSAAVAIWSALMIDQPWACNSDPADFVAGFRPPCRYRWNEWLFLGSNAVCVVIFVHLCRRIWKNTSQSESSSKKAFLNLQSWCHTFFTNCFLHASSIYYFRPGLFVVILYGSNLVVWAMATLFFSWTFCKHRARFQQSAPDVIPGNPNTILHIQH